MGKITMLGKTLTYRPYMDSMYIHKLQSRLSYDKNFIIVFQKNITDDFLSALKDTVNPDVLFQSNTILQIYGQSGTGKSRWALSLAKFLTPNTFKEYNVCFFDSKVLDIAKTLSPNSIIIRDEGVGKATYGLGSQRTSAQLNILIETVRKYGLSIFFIEPLEVRNELAKYTIELVDMDVEQRITRVAVKNNFTNQYLGAVYFPILPENDPLVLKYEEVKDKFIDDVREGKFTGAKEDYKSMALTIVEKIDLEIFKSKKERVAFIRTKHPTLTNGEIDNIATFVEIIIKHGTEALYDEEENQNRA